MNEGRFPVSGSLGGISNTTVVPDLQAYRHAQDNRQEKEAPEGVVWTSAAQRVVNTIRSNDQRQQGEEMQHLGAPRYVGSPPYPRQPRRWVGGAQYRYLASVQSGTDDRQRACCAPPGKRHYVMVTRFGELPPVEFGELPPMLGLSIHRV